MHRTRRSVIASAALLLAGVPLLSRAEDKWPSKTITYVVPFPPGGNTDVLARLLVPKLSAALGAAMIIDNRPGAGGSVGSALVSRAPADGYTLLGGTISSHAINVSLYPKIGYDPVTSFEPVAMLGVIPNMVLVRQDSPYKTIQELIAAAKAKKLLSCGSPGSGTSPHLALEMLKLNAGIDVAHVPYKGSGPALQDLLGGQIDLIIDTPVVAGAHLTGGKLRALAVTTAQRIPTMPDLPTLAESGVPGYEVTSWQAVFVPAGTPKPIVERLHTEIMKAMSSPEIEERLGKLGMRNPKMTREQFARFQRDEVTKWAEVIKKGNVKVE